ncbi:hypothetical protein [Actinoplanes sp. NPDC049265]|uniref:hypothetical protein n=1 Tax=Actinoplanes sp. NPDC049265 TaxID=3363902 RepID=UPI003711262D
MSDVPPGARLDAPPDPYAASGSYADPSSSTGGSPSAGDRAKQVAHEGTQSAAHAAGEVKETAQEQTQRVLHEAGTQARNLASDVRDRVGEQARSQNDKLVGTIRQTADQLDEMRGDRADGPAAAVVSRVAEGGRQVADYLDRHGPDGVLREVQDFARRRPGAFLATALAAGFVVGRLGKSVAKADGSAGTPKPASDAYVSHEAPPVATPPTSYGEGIATEYAATGTGTPEVIVPPTTTRPGGPL